MNKYLIKFSTLTYQLHNTYPRISALVEQCRNQNKVHKNKVSGGGGEQTCVPQKGLCCAMRLLWAFVVAVANA